MGVGGNKQKPQDSHRSHQTQSPETIHHGRTLTIKLEFILLTLFSTRGLSSMVNHIGHRARTGGGATFLEFAVLPGE